MFKIGFYAVILNLYFNIPFNKVYLLILKFRFYNISKKILHNADSISEKHYLCGGNSSTMTIKHLSIMKDFVFVLTKVFKNFNDDDGIDESIVGIYSDEELANRELLSKEDFYKRNPSDLGSVSFYIEKYSIIKPFEFNLKIKLFQIIPSKVFVEEKSGLSDIKKDVMYCNGVDCVSSCLSVLFDKGYKDFQINYLGDVDCLTSSKL